MPLRFLKHILAAVVLTATFAVVAQKKQQPQAPPICIIEEITADSVNVVDMPDGLWELIDYDKAGGTVEKVIVKPPVNPKPYSVQVYGDKSRNEANARAAKVQARFPQYRVRRHYNSPYFRVYLGAFETSKEAQELVMEVRKAFPSFASEVHWTKTGIGAGARSRR